MEIIHFMTNKPDFLQLVLMISRPHLPIFNILMDFCFVILLSTLELLQLFDNSEYSHVTLGFVSCMFR